MPNPFQIMQKAGKAPKGKPAPEGKPKAVPEEQPKGVPFTKGPVKTGKKPNPFKGA